MKKPEIYPYINTSHYIHSKIKIEEQSFHNCSYIKKKNWAGRNPLKMVVINFNCYSEGSIIHHIFRECPIKQHLKNVANLIPHDFRWLEPNVHVKCFYMFSFVHFKCYDLSVLIHWMSVSR